MGSAFRISWIIFALALIVGIAALTAWPGDDVVARNAFNGDIRYVSPLSRFLIFPAAIAFYLAIAHAAVRANPDVRVTQLRNTVLVGCAIVGFVSQLGLIAVAFGAGPFAFDGVKFVGFLIGALLIVVGNYLPKTARTDSLDLPRPWSYFFSIPWTLPFSYLFGVRTWWTLASDNVWNRTHRLAGRLWIISGLSIVVAPWLMDPSAYFNVFLATLVFIVVPPILYSFWLRQAEKHALRT